MYDSLHHQWALTFIYKLRLLDQNLVDWYEQKPICPSAVQRRKQELQRYGYEEMMMLFCTSLEQDVSVFVYEVAFFVTLDWAAASMMMSAMSVCLSARQRQRRHNSPSTHATTTASFVSSPPSRRRRHRRRDSRFTFHHVDDDDDVDGWSVRWWLLIDNVIYIIASTTESILACLPLPWQAFTSLVGQFLLFTLLIIYAWLSTTNC